METEVRAGYGGGEEEPFHGEEIFIILIRAGASQMDTYVKTHQIEYFKCVQQIVC